MSKSSLREKLDGNVLDLSLNELVEVPVKELSEIPKATELDLSCNKIESLPVTFSNLTFLVKLDLSKNKLSELPTNFGCLRQLQRLDLYSNELQVLPVSFAQLRSLKWLDLKNNPLEPNLKKAAGDCLDLKQCQQCAIKVVGLMQEVQSNLERERQKRLKEERALEAVRKAEEEKELQKQRQAKKAEKEKRKAKSKLKQHTENATVKDTLSQETCQNGKENSVKRKVTEKSKSGSFCWSLVKTLILLLLLAPVLAFAAQVALNLSQGPITPNSVASAKILFQKSVFDFSRQITILLDSIHIHSLVLKKHILVYSNMAYSKWFTPQQDVHREL